MDHSENAPVETVAPHWVRPLSKGHFLESDDLSSGGGAEYPHYGEVDEAGRGRHDSSKRIREYISPADKELQHV